MRQITAKIIILLVFVTASVLIGSTSAEQQQQQRSEGAASEPSPWSGIVSKLQRAVDRLRLVFEVYEKRVLEIMSDLAKEREARRLEQGHVQKISPVVKWIAANDQSDDAKKKRAQ